MKLFSAWFLSAFAQAATISIEPPNLAVNIGDSFTLHVIAADIVDLYAFQVDLVFDPVVLFGSSNVEGEFLLTAGSTFFFEGTIDNTAGTVSAIASTLVGPVSGASGFGKLAAIQFIALGSGASSVTLSGVVLLDSSLANIPFATDGGTVTVDDIPEPIPEPRTLELLLAGIAILLARMKSIRRGATRQEMDFPAMWGGAKAAGGATSYVNPDSDAVLHACSDGVLWLASGR
jgi:general secretion pathway protein D